MLQILEWADGVEDGQWIPVSFLLDSKPAELRVADASSQGQVRLETGDEGLQARLRLERDESMQFVRMGMTLEAGEGFSGRIRGVRILDLRIEHADLDAAMTLRTFTGGTVKHYSWSSFPPAPFRIEDHRMRGHDIARFREDTGRGSNQFLPIWLYGDGESGIWFAPEWHGSWSLEVHRLPEYTSVFLELDQMDFRLEPGRQVRLPDVVVGRYQGDLQDGGNQVRRVISARYLPQIGSQPPEPPLAYQVLGGHPDWMGDPQVFDEAATARRLGAESFTWSSFWQFPLGFNKNGRNWWDVMGPYRPHESRFPNGIEPLRKALDNGGVRLGLWVDPRIGLCAQDALEEARDVLLFFDAQRWEAEARKKYNDISYEINIQPLIDLSRPKGREYFTGILERMVEQCGARWIWFDMNTDPGFFHFATNQEPDQRGLLELQWFQGLDEVMTSFHEKYPDVWVEWCASGGRMISLAACRYSHSHWITDYVGPDPDIAGAIRTGANSILPAVCNHQSIYFDEDVKSGRAALSDEAVLAHFAGHLGLSQGLIHAPEPVLSKLEEMGRVWKSIRPLLAGDFYLLTGQARSREDWEIWQMHREDLGQGLVCIHRLSQSQETRRSFSLRRVGSACLETDALAGEGQLQAQGPDWTVRFDQGRALLVRYRIQ